MKQKFSFLFLAAMALCMTTGCAVSDYDGFENRQTQAESKLFGLDVSIIAGDPAVDGTYAYTVKYDNRGGRDVNMKIISYRNPVPDSFTRDGQVDRDGDDVQGRAGILGGKFLPQYVAVDPLPDCQFEANITQDHSGLGGPLATACLTVNEEIDKDLDLQAAFSSLGDLIGQVFSGALNNGFTAELTGLVINGVEAPLPRAVSIHSKANGLRPHSLSIDLTQPGGRELIQAILNRTPDDVPVSVGLRFSGGMKIDVPSHIRVAFNHQALGSLL
ncbi:MAG TPA: hypothetical protein VF789_04440 [Thermoanaerobaculia bacterium]